MSQINKQLNLLGLSLRAGKLVHGDESVEKAIKRHKVCVIILANDVSEATRERYQRFTKEYQVPLCDHYSREEISHAIGKARAICGISDKGLAKLFLSYQTGEDDQ